MNDLNSEIEKLRKKSLKRTEEVKSGKKFFNPATPKSHYNCPKCWDTGYLQDDLFTDDNGIDWAIPCDCGIKANNAYQSRIKFAEIPEIYKNNFFNNFNTDLYNDTKISKVIFDTMNYLNNFEDMKQNGYGLYLWSNTKGSGKTRLISSLANELLRNGYNIKFSTSLDILEEIKATWNKETDYTESELIKCLTTVDILVIDDFGVETPKQWINDKFFGIINKRYEKGLVTLYTSNYPINKLNYDKRITSRVAEKNFEIHFVEESIRERISEKMQMKF